MILVRLVFQAKFGKAAEVVADMKKMAADRSTQDWWKLTDPCQEPLETRKPGEWWASMEEFFHTD